MKKIASLLLILLSLTLLGQRCAQAGPLGLAGDFNVFVFGDVNQAGNPGTDVQGRLAAQGNVTYENFAIASRIANPSLNLVAGGNVFLTNGTVGATAQGEIWHGGPAASNVITNLTPGYTVQQGTPIDFDSEKIRLTALSSYLAGLTPTGRDTDEFSPNINLLGTHPTLNVFSLLASDIGQNISFNFEAPDTSTILVNIDGGSAVLMNFSFTFNGSPSESLTDPEHLLGFLPDYPYSHILFNFWNATSIAIDHIGVAGSILAPGAAIDFGANSHVDGNLIAASLTDRGESHHIPFDGNLPSAVPEPATLLLFGVGLVGMVMRRRK